MTRTVVWTMCALAVAGTTALMAGQAPRDAAGFDPAAVERGQKLLAAECGFCHGSTARGGSSGPDLTRSELVANDDNGRQLGDFLRIGRPDRGMPKFELTNAQVKDLATYLHSAIYAAASRREYKILDVVVGDPKA